jgi:hypothetical protein
MTQRTLRASSWRKVRRYSGMENRSMTSDKVNRRSLILGAIFLVGGAAALTRFNQGKGRDADDGPVLSTDQFALLEQVSDIFIPETDTPGARGAGVPEFIRQLLTAWGSGETRAAIVGVLESIEKQAWGRHAAGFLELPNERRISLVRGLDEECMARQDVPWTLFRRLVLVGYYHSEVGATQELRYELVPGAWRSCLPLTEVGRATAA